MKKILAIAIVVILTVALSLTAFAKSHVSPDQVTNVAGAGAEPEKNLAKFGGNSAELTELGDISAKLSENNTIFLWGWYSTDEGQIEKFGYRFGTGDAVIASEKYDTQDDVINAGKQLVSENADSSRFLIEVPVVKGENVELYGVAKLKDGTTVDFWKLTYTSTVGADPDAQQQGGGDDNPGTADAAVIAIAAVACIALAGVVVAKKVK